MLPAGKHHFWHPSPPHSKYGTAMLHPANTGTDTEIPVPTTPHDTFSILRTSFHPAYYAHIKSCDVQKNPPVYHTVQKYCRKSAPCKTHRVSDNMRYPARAQPEHLRRSPESRATRRFLYFLIEVLQNQLSETDFDLYCPVPAPALLRFFRFPLCSLLFLL